MKKELQGKVPEPTFKPQLSSMTLAMTDYQRGNVFNKLFEESYQRHTRRFMPQTMDEDDLRFKPSIGRKSAQLATKRREGIYSECCSEADYLTTAEPPDLSGDTSTHSEGGEVKATEDTELGPQHNGHHNDARSEANKEMEEAVSVEGKKKEMKVPIYDYLYEVCCYFHALLFFICLRVGNLLMQRASELRKNTLRRPLSVQISERRVCVLLNHHAMNSTLVCIGSMK